eukprot:4365306-Prorocentrum_lima.AAC.1
MFQHFLTHIGSVSIGTCLIVFFAVVDIGNTLFIQHLGVSMTCSEKADNQCVAAKKNLCPL